MTVLALALPPVGLSADDSLAVTRVYPKNLFRISRYPTGEPYFGNSGGNRFDAPGWMEGTPEFSSSYLGFSLAVAIAESLLHNEIPANGEFRLSAAALEQHYVHRFAGKALRMLNLTGVTLKRLAGNADLAGTASYSITQQWSLAVFRNPLNFDGFIYMSRHLNTERAAILFDRAAAKIQSKPSPLPLPDMPGFAAAAAAFNIVAI